MFYLNETLDATAAHSNGLITKIIADDFDKDLMTCCTKIASYSSQVSVTSAQTFHFWRILICASVRCREAPNRHPPRHRILRRYSGSHEQCHKNIFGIWNRNRVLRIRKTRLCCTSWYLEKKRCELLLCENKKSSTWALKVVNDFEQFFIFLYILSRSWVVFPICRSVTLTTAQNSRRDVFQLINMKETFHSDCDIFVFARLKLSLELSDRRAKFHLRSYIHWHAKAIVWCERCGTKSFIRTRAQFFHRILSPVRVVNEIADVKFVANRPIVLLASSRIKIARHAWNSEQRYKNNPHHDFHVNRPDRINWQSKTENSREQNCDREKSFHT